MSLTEEDKRVLVQLHLEKAHACLADAEQLMELEFLKVK